MSKSVGYIALILAGASLIWTGILSNTKAHSQDKHDPHVWIDPESSCQYLITPEGGIAMRMVDNGAIYIHMGCKPLVDIKKPVH
jgi:hypothetical protein